LNALKGGAPKPSGPAPGGFYQAPGGYGAQAQYGGAFGAPYNPKK